MPGQISGNGLAIPRQTRMGRSFSQGITSGELRTATCSLDRNRFEATIAAAANSAG
jgi:hypothetical protein